MLRNLRLISWDKTVGSGVTGAKYVTAQGIAKLNLTEHPYVVANEYVSGEIGRLIGLPLPPSYTSFTDDEEPIFVSMDFNPRGEQLPPIIPEVLITLFPEESAGIAVFDMFIGNSDRHANNLAFDRVTKQMAVFDHSHALFGYIPNAGEMRLTSLLSEEYSGIEGRPEPGGHRGNRHCLLDALEDANALLGWVDRIEQIPAYVIDRMATQVQYLGVSRSEAQALGVYLHERKMSLRGVLEASKAEFTKISQWGLI